MNDCIFCKIITGEIPSHKVYEDADSFAFLDISPDNPGHTLVVPKDHFENIYTIPEEALCRLMISVKKIALALKHAELADGVNINMNNEKAAGQVVFHAHIHVIPRLESDDFKFKKGKEYKEGEAESIRKIMTKSLEA